MTQIMSDEMINQFIDECGIAPEDMRTHEADEAMDIFLQKNIGSLMSNNAKYAIQLRRFKVRVLMAIAFTQNPYGLYVWRCEE